MATTFRKPTIEGPTTRLGFVRGYLLDRGVRNYQSVFAAHGVQFTQAEADRIADIWNARTRVLETDLPLIERMERVINVIRNAA